VANLDGELRDCLGASAGVYFDFPQFFSNFQKFKKSQTPPPLNLHPSPVPVSMSSSAPSPQPQDEPASSSFKKPRPSDENDLGGGDHDEGEEENAQPTEEELLIEEEYVVWRKNSPFLLVDFSRHALFCVPVCLYKGWALTCHVGRAGTTLSKPSNSNGRP